MVCRWNHHTSPRTVGVQRLGSLRLLGRLESFAPIADRVLTIRSPDAEASMWTMSNCDVWIWWCVCIMSYSYAMYVNMKSTWHWILGGIHTHWRRQRENRPSCVYPRRRCEIDGEAVLAQLHRLSIILWNTVLSKMVDLKLDRLAFLLALTEMCTLRWLVRCVPPPWYRCSLAVQVHLHPRLVWGGGIPAKQMLWMFAELGALWSAVSQLCYSCPTNQTVWTLA